MNLIRALAMALGTGSTSWSSRFKEWHFENPEQRRNPGTPTGWFTDRIHPWFRGSFSSAPSAALRAPRFLLVKADQGSRRAAEDAEKKQ